MEVPENSSTGKEQEIPMQLFAIDAENTITTFAAAAQIPEGQERFSSEEELFAASTTWPADRLVAIWNSFAGVAGFGADLKPLKKFTDRAVACKRIWNAVQKMNAGAATPAADTTAAAAAPAKAPKAKAAKKTAKSAPKATKPAKAAKVPKAAKSATPAAPRENSKKATVIEMMKRKGGATLNEIAEETGWARHTIRGFVSIAGSKLGLTIESSKNAAGERTYHVAK
jgi:hypothetical protein